MDQEDVHTTLFTSFRSDAGSNHDDFEHQRSDKPRTKGFPSTTCNIEPYPTVRMHVRDPSPSCADSVSLIGDEGVLHGLKSEDFELVWLAVTTSIRCKRVGSKANKPLTLVDFRGAFCLALSRLPDDATWNDVYKQARIRVYKDTTALIVQGSTSRPKELIIVALEKQDFDWTRYLNIIYVRIAPLDLLLSAMMATKEIPAHNAQMAHFRNQLVRVSRDTELYDLVGGMPNVTKSARLKSTPGPSVAEDFVDTAKLPNETLKALIDFIRTGAGTMEKISTLVKTDASHVASIFNDLSEATKPIPVVCATFQLMFVCIQGYVLVQESRRGEEQYPALLRFLLHLYRELCGSIGVLFQSSVRITEMEYENIRTVLERTIVAMETVEARLMSCKVMRMLRGGDVKKIETEVSALAPRTLGIKNQADIQDVRVQLENLRMDFDSSNVEEQSALEELCQRPRLCDYFSGRSVELEDIFSKLETYGKVLVTQHGGAGKTQLMIRMAEEAERRNLAPRGVFWIPAEGNRDRFLSSVARFAEAIGGRNMKPGTRRDYLRVFRMLNTELAKYKERFVLCLDGADDPNGNKILQNLCHSVISHGGWIVVTSRQGRKAFFQINFTDCVVQLNSLSDEMAMVVLWRWKTQKRSDEVTDEQVIGEMREHCLEHSALKTILNILNLSGLPLGLENAGSFVRRREISFVDYLRLLEEKGSQADLTRYLQPAKEWRGTSEEEQGIWSAWRPSMDLLSENAKVFLIVMALVGGDEIPESLARKVAKCILVTIKDFEATYEMLVEDELVQRTSLVQLRMVGEEKGFTMHPLIRQYIMGSISNKDPVHITAMNIGINVLHETVSISLQTYNRSVSFENLPRVLIDRVKLLSRLAHNMVQSSWRMQGDIQSEPMRKGITCALLECFPRKERMRITVTEQKLDDLYLFVMHAFRDQYLWKEGLKIGWKLIARYTSRLSREDGYLPEMCGALGIIGRMLCGNGDLEEADKVLTERLKTIRSRVNVFSGGRLKVTLALLDLGAVKEEQGLLRTAQELYRESIRLLHGFFGKLPDHPMIAVAMNMQGSVLRRQGLFSEAKEVLNKCYEMQLQLGGKKKDSCTLANTIGNMAMISRDEGNLSEAEDQLRECLAMRRRVFGDIVESKWIAKALGDLADILRRQKSYKAAEKAMVESVEMMERVMGQSSNHQLLMKARADLQELANEARLSRSAGESGL